MADQKKDTGKHRKKFSYRMIAELGSMAAIFVLGVTVYSQSRQITQLKQPAVTVQQPETETEKVEMGANFLYMPYRYPISLPPTPISPAGTSVSGPM